jgi:hypothetical protein
VSNPISKHQLMSPNHPTPYPVLNALLLDLANSQLAILGDNFVGTYLTGSLAIGDFDEHSDVDFLVVIDDEIDEPQLSALQAMHAKLHNHGGKYRPDFPTTARILSADHWEVGLEGSYFPKTLLRRHDLPRGKQWFLENGEQALALSDHDDNLVVRWTVRERGIPIVGPDPAVLIDAIPANGLRREVFAKMRSIAGEMSHPYWHSAFGQPYAVMTYCRMLQTLETATVRSKLDGVRWGLENLDRRWASLIQRAWDSRGYVWVGDPPDEEDFKLTLDFIQYAIGESDRLASNCGLD